MATYEEIYGKRVKDFDSDPTLDLSYEGQVWYNSATGTLKSLVSFGSWNSEANCSTTTRGRACAGTLTAALWNGGFPGSFPISQVTEEFDGFTFSSGGTSGSAHYVAGATGTLTAAIICSGYTNPPGNRMVDSETYDGSSWTQVPDVNTARYGISASGTTTAAIIYGGNKGGSPEYTAATESFDGSSWTTAPGSMGTARYTFSNGTGPSTAAIVAGGLSSPPTVRYGNTESYDGSSWSEGPDLNTARNNLAGWGTQTAMVVAGGDTPPATGATESFDGTSWSTESGTMATARSVFAGGGSNSSEGIISGGYNGSANINSSERFNKSINTITAAAWAAGGTVPYTSRQNMSFGTQTAAISCGGYVSSTLDTSVSYDGTSYSGTPALNVAARMGGVAGTQAAGLEFGGIQPPGTYNANMQSWNGSSWSNSPSNLNSGSYGIMGCGTSTAALRAGGENPSGGAAWNLTEESDGSSWTAGNTIPDGKYEGAGNGVQTSAVIAGGSPSGTSTYEYDGTNWTAGGALSTSRPGTKAGSAGVSSSSNIIFGGNAPPGVITATEGYDGTAWSTRPSLGTGRASTTGNGTATAGLMVSGGPPSGTSTATEEFTGTTETVTASTLTTS